MFKGYEKIQNNVYNFQVSPENFLFKNPKILNIIRDGTGKSKKLKRQKNEHYDLKNEERDESLVLFLLVERNLMLYSL